MLPHRFLFSLALLAGLFCAPPTHAQGGYVSAKYPVHGLKFELARDYEWLAVQPNEDWVVMKWVNSKFVSGNKGPRVSGRLEIVRIDYVSDPGPSTPSGEDHAPRKEKPKDKDAAPKKKAPPKPLPINRWSRYLAQKLPNWHASEVAQGKARDGFEATEYELRVKKGSSRDRAWAYVWSNDSVRTFLVLGYSSEEDYDKQVKIWRHTAEKMRFEEPKADPEVVKWQRYYRRRKEYKDPDYRIRVRTGLDGNWKAEDTENYIVIYNTKDQPLVRSVVSDLESIRKEYMRLFPPVEEIEAVSTVRICADHEEYMKYGGPPRSAGYWYYVTEELVLYDATKREKGKKTERLDTFIVVYHEAFHQFIHYSAGQLAPHSWFNEGYGDYFSGALIKGGKVKKIGPNPWRLNTIQRTIRSHEFVPWREILEYERSEYYGARQGYYYAQGWSMVYFLNECKKVQKHPQWSQILPKYFDELKSAWTEGRMDLEAGADSEDEAKNQEARGVAQKAARDRALQFAFDGVDIEELEKEWIDFTLSLKL